MSEKFKFPRLEVAGWAVAAAIFGLVLVGMNLRAGLPRGLVGMAAGAVLVVGGVGLFTCQKWGRWVLLAMSAVFLVTAGWELWARGFSTGWGFLRVPAVLLGMWALWTLDLTPAREKDRSLEADEADSVDATLKDLDAFVAEDELEDGVTLLENRLAKIEPATPFHAAIERDFLSQQGQALDWLTRLYDQASQKSPVTAMYLEMNSFDMVFDRWVVEGFAYTKPAEQVIEDRQGHSFAAPEPLVLAGMEDLQKAMAEYRRQELAQQGKGPDKGEGLDKHGDGSDEQAIPEPLRDAHDLAFWLIALHMLMLVKSAHEQARQQALPLGEVPLLASVHDCGDFLYRAS